MKKNNNLSKTKFNIAWASIITIFIGSVIYIPALKFSQKESEIVYYKIPVVTPMPSPPKSEVAAPVVQEVKYLITKDLKLGDVDPEVLSLQKYLNARGFLVASSGPGSPGQETTRFGAGTRDAVIKFQEANADLILKPFGLTKGTGIVGGMTRRLINS